MMLGSVYFLPWGGTKEATEDSLESGDSVSPFKKKTFESTIEKVMTSMSAQDQTCMDGLMSSDVSVMKDSQTSVDSWINSALLALDKVEERNKNLELKIELSEY